MSDIQQFYGVAQRKDFARQFQFRLIDFGPIKFAEELVYIETASLPGRQINNVTVPYMGLQFNTPGTVSYPGSDAWNIVFRCDQNYAIRDALELATVQTFDDATSTGAYGIPTQDVTLTMQLLGKKQEVKRTYTLYGVWIKSIDAANYDIKDNGAIQTVNCSLAYQFWRVNGRPGGGGNQLDPINPGQFAQAVAVDVRGNPA